jgi:hypothetical protein
VKQEKYNNEHVTAKIVPLIILAEEYSVLSWGQLLSTDREKITARRWLFWCGAGGMFTIGEQEGCFWYAV